MPLLVVGWPHANHKQTHRAGGKKDQGLFGEHSISVWEDEEVLGLDGGGSGRTTTWAHSMPQTVYSKMAEMALTSAAQLVGHHLAKQLMFLSHIHVSLPPSPSLHLSLKINK